MPASGMLPPTEMKTGYEIAENLTGEKAWEFADQAVEDLRQNMDEN